MCAEINQPKIYEESLIIFAMQNRQFLLGDLLSRNNSVCRLCCRYLSSLSKFDIIKECQVGRLNLVECQRMPRRDNVI